MDPLALTALVCTLCVAGIGAVYFVWVRKADQARKSQAGQQ